MMLAKRYTFLLVVISIITGMNDKTINENYINQSRAAFAYILNTVDKGCFQRTVFDNTEIKKSEAQARKLLLYKYITHYIKSSYLMDYIGYIPVLICGIVMFVFFENNSAWKNMLWRAYIF